MANGEWRMADDHGFFLTGFSGITGGNSLTEEGVSILDVEFWILDDEEELQWILL